MSRSTGISTRRSHRHRSMPCPPSLLCWRRRPVDRAPLVRGCAAARSPGTGSPEEHAGEGTLAPTAPALRPGPRAARPGRRRRRCGGGAGRRPALCSRRRAARPDRSRPGDRLAARRRRPGGIATADDARDAALACRRCLAPIVAVCIGEGHQGTGWAREVLEALESAGRRGAGEREAERHRPVAASRANSTPWLSPGAPTPSRRRPCSERSRSSRTIPGEDGSCLRGVGGEVTRRVRMLIVGVPRLRR